MGEGEAGEGLYTWGEMESIPQWSGLKKDIYEKLTIKEKKHYPNTNK